MLAGKACGGCRGCASLDVGCPGRGRGWNEWQEEAIVKVLGEPHVSMTILCLRDRHRPEVLGVTSGDYLFFILALDWGAVSGADLSQNLDEVVLEIFWDSFPNIVSVFLKGQASLLNESSRAIFVKEGLSCFTSTFIVPSPRAPVLLH